MSDDELEPVDEAEEMTAEVMAEGNGENGNGNVSSDDDVQIDDEESSNFMVGWNVSG